MNDGTRPRRSCRLSRLLSTTLVKPTPRQFARCFSSPSSARRRARVSVKRSRPGPLGGDRAEVKGGALECVHTPAAPRATRRRTYPTRVFAVGGGRHATVSGTVAGGFTHTHTYTRTQSHGRSTNHVYQFNVGSPCASVHPKLPPPAPLPHPTFPPYMDNTHRSRDRARHGP